MRFWLALLALLGLLLTPVAAAAAAPVCLEHSHMASMAAAPDMDGAHDCCPEPEAPKPAKSDHKACDTACALMAAGLAALPEVAPDIVRPAGRSPAAAAALEAFVAHPPATPVRPPRHLA